MAQHFEVTVDGQLLHREQHVHADALHLGAADTDEAHVRRGLLDGVHQEAAEQVAGGFTRDDGDGFDFLVHGGFDQMIPNARCHEWHDSKMSACCRCPHRHPPLVRAWLRSLF